MSDDPFRSTPDPMPDSAARVASAHPGPAPPTQPTLPQGARPTSAAAPGSARPTAAAPGSAARPTAAAPGTAVPGSAAAPGSAARPTAAAPRTAVPGSAAAPGSAARPTAAAPDRPAGLGSPADFWPEPEGPGPAPAGPKPPSAGRETVRLRLRSPQIVRLLGVAIMLLGWAYIAAINTNVPSIWSVLDFLWIELSGGSHGGMVLRGEFWGPLLESLQRYFIGLAIGIPAGLALGLLIGSSQVARGLLSDTSLALLALPTVVWAFLAFLWFGLTDWGPIMAVVLTVVPFVAVNVSAGVRSIDQSLVEMSQSFRVPLRRRVWHLLLGGTLPNACTGVRLAFTAGWNSLLIAEWFGATSGVGWRARFWYDALRYPGFVAWVLLYIVLIILLDRLMLRPIERRAFRWNERPVLILPDRPTL